MYQNRSTDQAGAWVPQMPGHGDWKDKPFANMLTEQQQIWWLYRALMDQEGDIEQDTTAMQELREEVTAKLEEMSSEVEKRLADMESKMYWLCTGGMHYDMSAGDYKASMARERRMWQLANPACPTVGQLGSFTVGELGTHTVGELANRGRYMLGLDVDYVVAPQMGWAEPSFKAADFLRRDELENLTADDVAAGKLYAFTETAKPTPEPDLAPYVRKGTVADVAGLKVLWNQHLVGPDYAVPAADE